MDDVDAKKPEAPAAASPGTEQAAAQKPPEPPPGLWKRLTAGHAFHILLHAVALVGGALIGLWVALGVDREHELRHRRILIPVLIEGADRQGGQFALGVSRAMEFAHRYRLDYIGDHQIEPWLLDERMKAADLVQKIKAEDPPIIVGPLRSTPALELVPLLARAKLDPDSTTSSQSETISDGTPAAARLATVDRRGLGIPVILGIPTNALITQRADLVWRLSPTDDAQGEFVAEAYAATVHRESPAVIIEDLRSPDDGGNPTYVSGLTERIRRAVNEMKLKGYPALEEKSVRSPGATSEVQQYFETRHPRTIIYVGMPDLAQDVLRLAQSDKAQINATWLFTDSCITSPEELIPRLKEMPGEFFITFQAPPAAVSKGLQQYMAYTVSTGGNVLFALDREKTCDRFLAAPSYEIFGFDSYLIALLVLKESKTGKRADVIAKIQERTISNPLLIGETYNFLASGDREIKDEKSKNTGFYLYEFVRDCTLYRSLDDIKSRRMVEMKAATKP
jgi:hypothetical protein